MNDKITIFSEWFVWRTSLVIHTEPYVRWAGPFESKAKADVWIAKSPIHGLRAGQSAIIWEEKHK